MTSESEAIKTNEFLRRRKLRLQQVREQSKDIAKKIRQRAEVEKLRQVVDLDAKKQKEYFECQKKLVKKLQVLYARGLENVGASHQSASEVAQQDEVPKTDLSKLRGKEATAELRRKKQEKLDQQKKLLDRKLQAREVANEISRDKSSVVANKLLSKSSNSKVTDETTQKTVSSSELANTKEAKDDDEIVKSASEAVKTSDMATQWDMETIPQEWEPAVPALSLPTDKDTPKDPDDYGSRGDKNKKLDLFALSEEMPSSLRGRHSQETRERDLGRPSLTIVSEYLQNRKLRLREKEPANTNKKVTHDIQSLKQTILRTRCSIPEVTSKGSSFNDKPKNIQENGVHRKNSVLMYNHSTRDSRDLPYGDNKLVERDLEPEEDAYCQAMREVSTLGFKDKPSQKKVQDLRNKVAVTKLNVEKEYKDTMNFLNSLPKDKCTKVIKNAYMDERRQRVQHEQRQQKMQQEYKKIEKECRQHHSLNNNRSKHKSSIEQDIEDNFDSKDLQYSWMPVPESDGSLAIHAIPNSVKTGKSGNSVKFSKVDSYHEYRSRHKHTPPTKDTYQGKHTEKKIVETVEIEDKDTTSDGSSVTSDTSSVENLRIQTKSKHTNVDEINKKLSDAERIIIYRVLDSRRDKKCKRQTKLLNEIAKSLTCIEKVQKSVGNDNGEFRKQQSKNICASSKSAENAVSFEQLNEGVYKMVEEQGTSYNMMSCCTTNLEMWQSSTPRKPWWDNVASMYFNDRDRLTEAQSDDAQIRACHCKKLNKNPRGFALHWESGDCVQQTKTSTECQCTSPSMENICKPSRPTQASTAASTSSFITATNDKGGASEGGYIKLLDETGQEAGKFFIGATGFLKNNAYEVVIQLKKKDGTVQDCEDNTALNQNKQPDNENSQKPDENDQVNNLGTEPVETRPPSEVVHEVLAYRSAVNKESTMMPLEQDPTVKNILSDDSNVPPDKKDIQSETIVEEEGICLVQSTSTKKTMCDKSVHTIMEPPVLNQPPRPATTTYTQTSNSPIHRPVFFHMSSSTSTAYMSPPEIILPKYLRHDISMTEDEICETQTIETSKEPCCKEYTACTCVKCIPIRRSRPSQINVPPHCRKRKSDSKMVTPPNSANKFELGNNDYDILRDINVPCKPLKIDKRKCKHHNRGNSEARKRQCHRYKRPSMGSFSSTRNINLRGVNQTSRRCKSTSSGDKKPAQSKLNPIIKDYVKKLLALNREGLKAVEVADQECSSVCTPSSSIINDPLNIDERKNSITNSISLQQIKNVLKQQIIQEQLTNKKNHQYNAYVYSVADTMNNLKYSSFRLARKKPVHKVKSLNISKNLVQKAKTVEEKPSNAISQVSQSSTDDTQFTSNTTKKTRRRSSPSPRHVCSSEPASKFNDSASTTRNSARSEKNYEQQVYTSSMSFRTKSVSPTSVKNKPNSKRSRPLILPSHRATETDLAVNSGSADERLVYKNKEDIPNSMSTQTNNTNTDFIETAEDKLHKMEKIADLTEKCTKRLSNLAKVLQEVRKNKSLAYSQISSAESTDSQSDHKSDKQVESPTPCNSINIPQRLETKTPEPVPDKENTSENEMTRSEYILSDVPKPCGKTEEINKPPKSTDKLDSPLHLSVNTAELSVKSRQKPPPALSRLSFKHGQEFIVPHELSTVIEVDSPMSMKLKNQSTRNEAKDTSNNSNRSSLGDNVPVEEYKKFETGKETRVNPDLLQTNAFFPKKYKFLSTESSDESKFQMIDLKQFNEIMLEPFISIQEYAKQYNMDPPDEGSNLEDIQKEDAMNDDISSLHSDGSLPDVIAELLKRNIITEPFKFDTASNMNSTTISSESTLSMLALSKARRDRKRNTVFQNKENIGETSDTLSISSNPDLETAFKKLGMGWASSTLKKTKERLALSSSSNTSSSSLSQFKIKSFNQGIPALVTDSVPSMANISKGVQHHISTDNSKNAEQQTTLSNSMTVKEFLRNELAKKITFTNKSHVNNTQEEFVSLFETKMPDELKDTSQVKRGDRSGDSGPSGANRARTSTPVQLFKSMTYHSSSSSNLSNGLFSNADDLSSVKMTSNSMKNHSTSDKDDLTIPNFSLRMKKTSDCSKSD